MTKVWILKKIYRYEGDCVMGVYSTPEKATEAQEVAAKEYPDSEWGIYDNDVDAPPKLEPIR